jgi:hypothetical protein
MVEIVRRMGWSYVSIIYEESNYGIKVSFRRFHALIATKIAFYYGMEYWYQCSKIIPLLTLLPVYEC